MYYQLYHPLYMSTSIFKNLEFRVILKEEKVKEQRGGQKHLKKKTSGGLLSHMGASRVRIFIGLRFVWREYYAGDGLGGEINKLREHPF